MAAEFWVVTVPDTAGANSNLRLLKVDDDLAGAIASIDSMNSDITGRVAVLERKHLYKRQLVASKTESADAISTT